MFSRWLAHIHQQPKPVRERYALFATVAVMAVIVGLWATGLPSRLAAVTEGAREGQAASAPLSGFWQQLKEQFDHVPDAPTPVPPATNTLEDVVRRVERGEVPVAAPAVATSAPIQIRVATTSATTETTTSAPAVPSPLAGE